MTGLFFTVAEMAGILGITERSVYRLGKKVPGYCKIGGRVYYNRQTFLKMTLGTQEPERMVMAVDDRHSLM